MQSTAAPEKTPGPGRGRKPEGAYGMGAGLRAFLDERGIRYIWLASKLGISPTQMTRILDSDRLIHRHALTLVDLFGDEARQFIPQPQEAE